MKKVLGSVVLIVAVVAGCNNKKTLTADLTGSWSVYKFINDNIDRTSAFQDSFPNYTIVFTGDKFVESYAIAPDTFPLLPDSAFISGSWHFEQNNGKLILEDSVYTKRTYTIFNLETNHVELRKDVEARYLRKNQ